jgi:hypothetical protein
VAAVGMAQRSLQRNGDSGRPDIHYLHDWFHDTTVSRWDRRAGVTCRYAD